MTKEQQNMAWQGLPPEAKELARNLYRTSGVEQYMTVLELLFGEENLTGEQHTDKIKIEDMTLAQIKELKGDLSESINFLLNNFEAKTGLHPIIKVTYEEEIIKSENGEVLLQNYHPNIDIKLGNVI